MTSLRVGNRRLLKLADGLDVADAEHRKKGEPTYDQRLLKHSCGTPGCAVGHAWATPAFRRSGLTRSTGSAAFFAVNGAEWDELFCIDGCGDARTAKQAARYIRKFVRRREKGALLTKQAG